MRILKKHSVHPIIFGGGQAGTIIAGQYGTLVLDPNTGAYSYRLDNGLDSVQELGSGQSLTDTFTVIVTDKHGASVSNTFTVTVEGTNDVPLLFVEPNLVISEGEASVSGQATGYDADVSDRGTFAYSLDGGGLDTTNAYGRFAIDASTGKYTFTLDNDSNAVKELALGEVKKLTFTVQLTSGGDTVQEVVTVYIKGTNSTPVLTLDAPEVQEDTTLIWNGQVTGADADHNAVLQYFLDKDGSNVQRIEGKYGVIVLNPKTGEYTYTLNNGSDAVQQLADGQTEYDTFTVIVQDEHGAKHELALNVAVKGTNDAPTISGAPNLSVTEQTMPTSSGTITATDLDSTDVLLYGVKSEGHAATGTPLTVSGNYGKLTVNADGTYSYTLDNRADALAQGETQQETFTLTVNDQHGGVVEQNITVSITGTNNAPTIESNSYTAEIAAVTDMAGPAPSVNGTLTYKDVDHGDMTSMKVLVGGGSLGAPGNGLTTSFTGTYGTLTAVVTAEGTITYSYTLHAGAAALAAGVMEDETFTLFVKDRFGASVPQEVTFHVTGANDTPTIAIDDATREIVLTDPAMAATLSGSLTIWDPDGTLPTVSLAGGTLQANTITVQGDYGVLQYNTQDHSYTYKLDPVTADTAALLANGSLREEFLFSVSDGELTSSDTLHIDITATGHVYAMTANEGSYTATTGSYVLGSTGDDLIYGSGENDVLFGGAGNDYLHGGAGNNQLYGGEGNDILMFSASNTVMNGGAGIDFLVGVTDMGSIDTMLAAGTVSNIDVIVTGANSVNLTSLTSLAALGLTVSGDANTPHLTIDANTWKEDTTAEHVPDGYTAYTHDEMTIFVAKSLLENQGG